MTELAHTVEEALTRFALVGADLVGANLTDARGTATTVLPAGWVVSDAELIVRVA